MTDGEEQTPEASTPTVMRSELALEAPSLATPEALEVAIPAHMTPLHLQLGDIKRVYKCWVKDCREGPSTSHATICVHVHRDHLGVGLACPSCNKTFSTWMTSGITGRAMFPNDFPFPVIYHTFCSC